MNSTALRTSATRISSSDTGALLFDLDGTVIDNVRFHIQSWQLLLREMGHDWTIEEIQARIWGKNEEIFERLFPGQYTAVQVRELSHKKERHYIESYRPHIKMIDGLEDLLLKAKDSGLRLAAATAAPRICVEFVYESLDLSRYMELVVQSDEVTRSKPHPETFLTAAKRLGVDADRCVVFEDSPTGAKAAHGAGMGTYVLLTSHQESEFSEFDTVRGFLKDYTPVEIG